MVVFRKVFLLKQLPLPGKHLNGIPKLSQVILFIVNIESIYRHLQLGNLIVLYDDNHVSIDGMFNQCYTYF
jgi:hypothetical protein